MRKAEVMAAVAPKVFTITFNLRADFRAVGHSAQKVKRKNPAHRPGDAKNSAFFALPKRSP
jgi:hypothetical protein